MDSNMDEDTRYALTRLPDQMQKVSENKHKEEEMEAVVSKEHMEGQIKGLTLAKTICESRLQLGFSTNNMLLNNAIDDLRNEINRLHTRIHMRRWEK